MLRKANEEQNIPKRYQGDIWHFFNTPQAKQALSAVKAGKSIFLFGACGSGKTSLAVALMNNWFADSFVVDVGSVENPGNVYPSKGVPKFITTQELLLEIKQSWHDKENRRAASQKEILDRYGQAPLLTLDDIGAEKAGEWVRDVLTLMIDRRYRDCKQTIITSNLGLDKLAETIDDRIASRIVEMCEIIDMGPKDWRVK